LAQASRSALSARSRADAAEAELQLMARELSARRAQLKKAEMEADSIVQRLLSP
jgi:hypothetical protein